MRKRSLLAGLVFLTILGCENPSAPALTGQWGGPEASLDLATTGGTVEYSCGGGTINPGWTLSEDGQWMATGEYFSGGGPAPSEGRPPHPAAYAGKLLGDRLTFSVTVTDLDYVLGPFTVERDQPRVSIRCL
jgi:hypothetical protein